MDIEGRSITITSMKPEHIERLAEIETECFSTPWSYESLAAELSNPLAVFLVAEYEGNLAGYVGMTQVIDEGYMANLAVTPKYRRHGVAHALLEELMQHAREQELSFITLEVRKSNEAARHLYESFEFEVAGERKQFYVNPVEDALIMTRTFK
ncbi:ribosomal-protein-alanine N-acetyltransferase [Hydrogenoanaerobacterium saccharovorans]|uniref:[Ribosomal protein bS18]-alanine N-acetyltransferase n=1 Tax=Hydrogenoanaerobacterium saccharovorans TaxID=474960 RepID=A0A1H8B921_9FIRM|nr:ribosomal protein S18-alanine N-acetyltransferase [Hydrogenoanaerobacterium saccharovorans]RPF47525.1 ribosomal-protein-alanine N-acetyltransferase [Hydrogenoanaerobacterium saccharovorans]SEM79303.1 ribosomal-protein-alanine N-acetyltransferase [Hydrogenoanaerobacterium saccharovorans]